MIPKLHYISKGSSPEEHLINIQKACSAGVELVQLNLEDISEKQVLKFAKKAKEITTHFQTRLILNEYYKIVKEIKADGVHFKKSNFYATKVRNHLYPWQIIGANANNLKDCEKLLSNNVDYITLYPFKEASIKDNGLTALGLNGYSAIIDALKTETPIIGFGNITTKDVNAILETGISGIGVTEQITDNFDNIKIFHQLLKASIIDEKRHRF